MSEVHYYFKKQTKYPPRIFVFMNANLWRDRNRRTMGLAFELPFLKRKMNSEGIEYEKQFSRLHAYQYERWEPMLEAEIKEAQILDKEFPGEGTGFFNQLLSFQNKYPLAA